MKLFESICIGFLVLSAMPLYSQVDTPAKQPAPAYGADDSQDNNDIRMRTPPPVSGQSYPIMPISQERPNYLRAGVTFSTAYSDNVLGATGPNSTPASDVSYSVWPTLALDETTTRLHWAVNYAPGYTFYQSTSGRNEADQTALIDFQYRLSPHVTFSAEDNFQKTSNLFNQPDLASAGKVSGGAQGGSLSVIAPISDLLQNTGNMVITYQFAANEIVGAGGVFTNLHFLDQALVPGLFDSESQNGSAFYAYRASQVHYIGVSYQYQRLLSFPTQGQNETQTHAILAFYTLSPSKRFSVSFFGGPQYADIGPQFLAGATQAQPGLQTWTPAAGASMNWQGHSTSAALSYSHLISVGSGLSGAVQMDSANASFQRQLTRSLNAALSGGYGQGTVVGNLPEGTASTKGHNVLGTASLQQQLGQHFSLQLGYTRIHQTYNVAAIATTPDTNREFVSVSYQFSRPLGR
jgi:hypothetical protein